MDAFTRRPNALGSIHQVVNEAAMPGLARLERDIEAQTPVGTHRRLAISLAGANDDFTAKILIAISDPKNLPLLRPRSDDTAPPHDVFAFHLENVGEIGAHRDFQVETNRLLAVVDDVEVLVQSAIDMTPDHQAQRTRSDRSVLGYEGAVCLENTGRVSSNGAAV